LIDEDASMCRILQWNSKKKDFETSTLNNQRLKDWNNLALNLNSEQSTINLRFEEIRL